MNKSDRAWLIASAVGLATFVVGIALSMALFPRDTTTDGRATVWVVVVMVLAIAVAVGTGVAWSRVEDYAARMEEWASRAVTVWPENPPTVRFCAEKPDTLAWGPGMAPPREVIARIEGNPLHRRLVLAARELITRDAEYAPLDGVDFSDYGEPFQAVVRCIRGDQENVPNRWLIIVRDPEKVGDEFTATTVGTPVVTRPSVLAAVVTFKKGTLNWRISVEELHALDAAYVAGCAMSAWEKVAYERDLARAGTTAIAKLSGDGITWEIDLHTLTTESDGDDADDRLAELLGELRVPVRVAAWGSLPDIDDDDAEDEEHDDDHHAAGQQADA